LPSAAQCFSNVVPPGVMLSTAMSTGGFAASPIARTIAGKSFTDV